MNFKKSVKIAVIDYGMGNLRSVCRALETTGVQVFLIDNPRDVEKYQGLVFPGQGAISKTMYHINRNGFSDAIKSWIADNRPYFGVCLGMQALFDYSEEGKTAGLGIFPGIVRKFSTNSKYKVPHMGWNTVDFVKSIDNQKILEGIVDKPQFYFVHSYYIEPEDLSIVWGRTEYPFSFASAIRKGNTIATQFHPEKSQSQGLQLYYNFAKLCNLF